MASVDFTLQDVVEHTEAIVERALVREREYTRQIVVTIVAEEIDKALTERVPEIVSFQLMEFWDGVLEPALDDIHAEIGEVKHSVRQLTRVVNQHSRDIMDLRSRLA